MLKTILISLGIMFCNATYSQLDWNDVGPIFSANCGGCHTSSTTSGVNLSSHANALASIGSQYGTEVIVPGSAATSPLFDKISNSSPAFGSRMPFGPALSSSDISLIENWINQGAVALPVVLTKFIAESEESKVVLKWSTASEINNDQFVIEHSKDRETFYEIAKVKGQGNSTKQVDYQYTDNFPTRGHNYYRLKQIDFDGGFEYSKIVSTNTDHPKWDVQITQSPEEVNIRLNSNEDATVTVFNTQGRRIYTSSTNILDNSNLNINSSTWQRGLYFFVIESKAVLKTYKLVL